MKIALLILLSLPGILSSQDVNLIADKDPFLAHSLIDNLQASKIGFGAKNVSGERVLFEADLVPYIVSPNLDWLPLFPKTLVVSPRINLRMFNSQSRPVKTPSYRPSLTMYWYSQKVQRACYECFHSEDNSNCISNIKDVFASAFLSVKIEHFSNGEDGTFFLPTASAGPLPQVNFRDGNFSTNFIEPSIHFLTSLHSQGRFYLQWHPNINREQELNDHYGFFRVGGEGVWGGKDGKSFLRARAEVILDKYVDFVGTPRPAIDRWSVNLRYERNLFGWSDIGWFGDLYLGPDYYNLRFVNNLRAFQVGLYARLYRVSGRIGDLGS